MPRKIVISINVLIRLVLISKLFEVVFASKYNTNARTVEKIGCKILNLVNICDDLSKSANNPSIKVSFGNKTSAKAAIDPVAAVTKKSKLIKINFLLNRKLKSFILYLIDL